MARILLVNDDGFLSKGLPLTYYALAELGDVTVIVPEIPKSGGGHSVTLHKPIFIREIGVFGFKVHIINGTPVDAIHVARSIMNLNPDLVVSGVNIGENTSAQNMLYSGTIGAALEAGLFGYPAIAFSADVPSDDWFERPAYSAMIRKIIRGIVSYVIKNGWFKGVDMLSVNIPKIENPLGAKIAKAQRIRFVQRFEKRIDPRGREYYWLVGERIIEKGMDADVLTQGYVVITPLKADPTHPGLSGCGQLPKELDDLTQYLNGIIKEHHNK